MNQSEQFRCKICRSAHLRQRPFGYEFNGRWLQAWECRHCRIIFIDPQPTPEELIALYSKEYFDSDFRCGHAGSYFDPKTLERLSGTTILQEIKKLKPSGNFLEVGCAGGVFLHAAQQLGFEVYGVEFSEDAAKFARDRFQLNVIAGEIRAAGFPAEMFDVVFLGDVLEHFPDPVDTMMELHRIMADGGLLVVACPTQTNTLFSRIGFIVYDTLGKKARVRLSPYHLFEYRPRSLIKLLKRTGFSVLRCQQTMIPPKEINLRGSTLEKIGKKAFQYPNYLLNKLFGILGDRIEVFASKR